MEDVLVKRQDTKLESEGAEFLVLGHLLIEGISAYKAYVNFPGYDLVAVNPSTRKSANIQVKSRWATDYDNSFPLKSLDCDFVVHVALNRGYRFNKNKGIEGEGIKIPAFYIFPIDVLKSVRREKGWNKVNFKKLMNYEQYQDNWSLIKSFLQ
jgi:hypothetical protein